MQDGLTVPSPSVATSGGGLWNFADNALQAALQVHLAKQAVKASQNSAGVDRLAYTNTVEVPVGSAVVVDEQKVTAQQQQAAQSSQNIIIFGTPVNKGLLVFSGVMLGLAVFVKKVL